MLDAAKIKFYCQSAFIIAWLAVTFAALAAMFYLWWGRERRLYLNANPNEQRILAMERAGLPLESFEAAKTADKIWPHDVSYTPQASEVQLSYFKYLMIPRIPSGSKEFVIEKTGSKFVLSGSVKDAVSKSLFSTVHPTPQGLVLSAIVLIAIAAGLSRFGLSPPESVASACLLLCITTVLFKPVFHSYHPIGILVCLLGLLGILTNIFKRPANTETCFKSEYRGGLALKYLSIAVVAGALLWSFLMAVVVVPDDWDAWAQWAPKAKVLVSPGTRLSDVQYFVPGSADYPLLWPAVWAFSGWSAGGWEDQWSKGWSVFFLLLTAWQLKIFSSAVTGYRSFGWMFAALLVSMPVVPLVASWAYAESALWLMMICATCRLLAWRDKSQVRDLFLAGVFLAAASSTKNEGLFFSILSIGWVYLCSRSLMKSLMVGLPTIIISGLWGLYSHFAINASNHILESFSLSHQNIGNLLSNIGVAGFYVFTDLLDIKQWNLVMPAMLIIATWTYIRKNNWIRINFLLPLGLFSGLFIVIVFYGENWLWQLSVAWNRLMIQFSIVLFPTLISALSPYLTHKRNTYLPGRE